MENDSWRHRLVEKDAEVAEVLRETRRMAVIGIKTESQSGQPAFYVPEYLKRVGFQVIPVPVYYPEATEILGEKVFRTVSEIPEPVDLVVLFRRPRDVTGHVEDILAARPAAVWLQSGIRNEDAARRFAEAGIKVVQDRCTMVEHRRLR